MYLYYPYARDGSSRETRVKVRYEFKEDANKSNNIVLADAKPKMLLFDSFKKIVILKIQNGRYIEVISNQV